MLNTNVLDRNTLRKVLVNRVRENVSELTLKKYLSSVKQIPGNVLFEQTSLEKVSTSLMFLAKNFVSLASKLTTHQNTLFTITRQSR